MYTILQLFLAAVAALGIGYALGTAITYWRCEWRRQSAEDNRLAWLAWRNDELEALLERLLEERAGTYHREIAS